MLQVQPIWCQLVQREHFMPGIVHISYFQDLTTLLHGNKRNQKFTSSQRLKPLTSSSFSTTVRANKSGTWIFSNGEMNPKICEILWISPEFNYKESDPYQDPKVEQLLKSGYREYICRPSTNPSEEWGGDKDRFPIHVWHSDEMLKSQKGGREHCLTKFTHSMNKFPSIFV